MNSVVGISSTVVLIVWAVMASSSPATNRFASKKEKLYIQKSLAVESSKQSLSVWTQCWISAASVHTKSEFLHFSFVYTAECWQFHQS